MPLALGEKLSPVLPVKGPEDELAGRTVRLPLWMWAKLDSIADRESYSRNELHIHLVKWAIQKYEEEKAAEPEKAAEKKKR